MLYGPLFITLLLSLTNVASAAGYYNLGAFLQPAPVTLPELGYIGSNYQVVYCPKDTWITGFELSSGWVIDHAHLKCSDGSTTVGQLGGSAAIDAAVTNTCAGANNPVTTLALRADGYMHSVSQFSVACRDGSSYVWGGSGAGGWGTWTSSQSCPSGYAPIGAYSNWYSAAYFSSMGLICGWFNMAPAMMGYWRLSETSGTTATDISGKNNTGTYQTGTTINQSGYHINDNYKAVTFNGSTGYMSSAVSITLPSSANTIELWFKTTSATKMGIAGFENAQTGTGSTSYGPSLETETDGRITYYVFSGAAYTITSGLSYNDGEWHHAVASVGPKGMQLWIDEWLVAENTSVKTTQSFAGYWRLGYCKKAGTYFNGSIDNAIVYSSQLSESLIEQQYLESGNPIPPIYPFYGHTFSAAGVTGRTGPTLTNLKNVYTPSWKNYTALLDSKNGVQIWTVPEDGTYKITAAGAAGGYWIGNSAGYQPGNGRIISGDVTLKKGQNLYIVVGQRGMTWGWSAGGGGGSFVYLDSISAASYLAAAGGGAGAGAATASDGQITLDGAAGTSRSTLAGGTAGTGGGGGGGGQGFENNGTAGSAGLGGNGAARSGCSGAGAGGGGGLGVAGSTFAGGASNVGTAYFGWGGFGGGGGGGQGCEGGGGNGGGGGYSGGGGGSADAAPGGGGGSALNPTYVSNPNTNVGTNQSAGYVTVEKKTTGCTPGSTSYTTAGSYSWTVPSAPNCIFVVELWGGGGGGSCQVGYPGTAGGSTTFNDGTATLTAGGGGGGSGTNGSTGSAGGSGSGGTTNIPGEPGTASMVYPSGYYYSGRGGNGAHDGGRGGKNVGLHNEAITALASGGAPGGGGGGGKFTASTNLGGSGGGAYVYKAYAPGELVAGSSKAITVGVGGTQGTGCTGGLGGAGQVTISWK